MENMVDGARRFDQAVGALCPRVKNLLLQLPAAVRAETSEVRLRVQRPVALWRGGRTWFVTAAHGVVQNPAAGVCAEKSDLAESFRMLCSYSVYSHQAQIREGYVTLRGGHRAGLAGTALLQNGAVTGMRDITSLNLRIARQMDGCARELLRQAGSLRGGLLLAGPPASGKTTLLRDIARQLSSGLLGEFCKVTVVDERGELCGVQQAAYGSNLGPCCDVLDGFPKAAGMLLALRTLSPEYLLCDELGTAQETEALLQCVNAGATVIASVHAGSLQELVKRPQGRALLQTGAFETIALLAHGSPGQIRALAKAGDLLAADSGSGVPAFCGDSGGLSAIA